MADHEPKDWDTVLCVPGEDWAARFMIQLRLEGEQLDLRVLEDRLLDEAVFDALDVAIGLAQPGDWTTRQIRHSLTLLRVHDYVLAWPPLVTGVEGLYWEEAIGRGLIDRDSLEVRGGEYAGRKARDAHDVFRTLPLNDRVRRALSRYAFGAEANAFRHGLRGAWGERQQCAIWILALVAWLDVAGWRHFNAASIGAGGRGASEHAPQDNA